MIKTPTCLSGDFAVLDFESVAELEECAFGSSARRQTLPVPEVVADYIITAQ